MNPDFAAFAIPTLIDFCVSLGRTRVLNGYTPNKVLRQYLRETTWFYPWARESGDDILYSNANGSPLEIEANQRLVEATRKRVSAVRTANMWTALLFGGTFGKHAMATQLYRDFNLSVLERSGVTVAGEGSNCSLGTRADNVITPWQQMVFFYLAGEDPKAIRIILKSLHVLLSEQTLLLLPLNMAAFVSRMQKTLSSEEIADQIRTVTLDASYPIIAEFIMADLLPNRVPNEPLPAITGHHDRPVPIPGILDRQRRLSLPDESDDVTYIGPSSQEQQQRRHVIVNQQQQQNKQPRAAAVVPNTPSVVKWTVVEEELFAIDDTWSLFKQKACLSPEHPARATIRVYLASLPKPKVLIPHHKFVMDVMPYCDVYTVANLPELVEFCRLFEDGWTWPPAKVVTRLIWTYDPYSTGAVDPKLAAYLRKYPGLTTEVICGLLPVEFDMVYKK
jgi:hypothetical protein